MADSTSPSDDAVARAAEVALGLDPHATESAPAHEIARWENDFSQLATSLPPVEPPAAVWAAIARQIAPPKPRQWRGSLPFWRGMAVAGFVLAIVAWMPWSGPPAQKLGTLMVATLRDQTGAAAYSVSYDATRAVLVVVPFAPDLHQGVVWVVRPGQEPVSIGTLGAGDTTRLHLSPSLAALTQPDATLTITSGASGAEPTVAAHGRLVAY